MESERRIKRRKKKIRRNIIIAVVALISLLSYFLINNQFVKGLYYRSGNSVSDNNALIELEEGIKANFTVFDDLLISYSKNGIFAYDISLNKVNIEYFEQLSESVMDFNNIMLTATDKYLMAYDKGGREILLFNKNKIIHNLKLTSSIILAKPLNNGGAIIVAEDVSAKNQVILLNKNGNQEFIWHSGVNNIIDAAFSYKKNVLTVVTADLSTGSLNSKLLFFDISSATAFSELTLSDVFVTNVNYYNDSSLLAISDRALYYFNANGEMKNTYSFNEKMLSRYSLLTGGSIAMSFKSTSQETITEIVNNKGKLKGSFTSEDEVIFIHSFNGNILLVEKRGVDIISKGGFLLRKIAYEKDLNKAFFIGTSKIVMIGNSEIRVIN